jgi:D-alanyl-D-alanine carboxypeptidase/D-alanyl-D-alanine-endopeptidase (penicillin-binding protein 4)
VRKRRFTRIIAAALCLIPLMALAAPPPKSSKRTAASRPTSLAQLIADKLPEGVQCGAKVIDLGDGRVVFERDANVSLIPASNAKIFILAAALDQLGENFTFKTPLLICGDDLVVIGDGDPAIGDSRLCELANESIDAVFLRWADALRARGIQSIPGNLVIDDSIFESTLTHPTWASDDLQKWYAAPVGGLNFNDNVLEVTVWPAQKAGAPVRWESTPSCSLIQINNRAKSGGEGDCVIARPSPDFRFVLSGNCTARGTLAPVTVPDPALFFADALRTAFTAKGIRIEGEIVRRRVRQPDGSLPAAAACDLLATHTTPLRAVLSRIGKNSQNLFAECLLKRLGYADQVSRGEAAPVGSWDSGRAAVEAFLRKLDGAVVGAVSDRNRASGSESPPTADRSPVVIADASGLSRDNRTSAADLTRVLAYMYNGPNRQLFVDSLSDAGSDGSLEKRMKHINGRVYAKTGYIRGVRTLSGYVVTPRGDWLAFSVLFNGFKGAAAPLNAIHDEFCRLLAGYTRENAQ